MVLRKILMVMVAVLLANNAAAAARALIPDALIDGVGEQLQTGLAVIVDGEYIVGVVPVADLPADIERLPLPGLTLMPGLINGHEHPLIYSDDYQNAHLAASN